MSRAEEVHPCTVRSPGGTQSRRNGINVQRRCVAAKVGIGRSNTIKFAKDFLLDLQALECSFNDEFTSAQSIEIGTRHQRGAHGLSYLGRKTTLGHITLDELLDEGDTPLQPFGIVINEDDGGISSSKQGEGNARTHGTSSNHTNRRVGWVG